MRLLIVTQKIDQNDAVLGFMHGWIAEFARHTETVTVICLESGSVTFPENVTVFSLGKEKITNPACAGASAGRRKSRIKTGKRIVYSWRLLRYIVTFRKEYDAVFVHMNPEYVVLAGWFWKLWGKTVTLWYAHKSVPWHLRVALFFTDIVFTSTTSGFRLPSRKVRVVGQGIDTEKFQVLKVGKFQVEGGEGKFRIITVGRITPSKDYDTLIDAAELLQQAPGTFKIDVVGPVSLASDESYFARLKEKIAQKNLGGIINFVGPVANKDLPAFLGKADLFVNMGHTGSLDKAVPEAMAMGLPVLTCNEAFKEVLGPFIEVLMYPKSDPKALAAKMSWLMVLSSEKRQELGQALRQIVTRNHSLQTFVTKIISVIGSLKKHVQ